MVNMKWLDKLTGKKQKAEVKQEKEVKEVYFESYTIANSNNMVGTFFAPYEGKHGWFFRNTSDEDVEVNLRLKGQYAL